MLQALFLFDEKNKMTPKTVISDIDQIYCELGSIGLVSGMYPVDHAESEENVCLSKNTMESIKAIQKEHGFDYYDLASIGPGHIEKYEEVKKRNSQLHWHLAPETRLFLKGGGAFGIFKRPWLGICLLNAGGFVQIPEKTYHWFDYGKIDYTRPPEYQVVRFWKNEEEARPSAIPHPATSVGNVVDWIQPFPTYDVLLSFLQDDRKFE
jgi:cupin superfamily acireductone dioxygenase involved in methionine salvage